MISFVYTASDSTVGLIHLCPNDGDPRLDYARTLCGKRTVDWELFDETASGCEASCGRCRSIASHRINADRRCSGPLLCEVCGTCGCAVDICACCARRFADA